MGKFTMKKHTDTAGREVLAVSDSDLVGKTLYDDDREIEFLVSREFYAEEELDEQDVISALSSSGNINLIGNEIVDIAIKEKIVDEDAVIDIGGTKHAQVYRI